MAANERKTSPADSGGDSYQSSVEKREAAYGDEEMNDATTSPENAIDGVAEAVASGQNNEDWAFSEKKPLFSKQVILGGLGVTVLVAVFCVLVVQNFKGNKDTEADGSPRLAVNAPDAGSGDDKNKPEEKGTDPFLKPAPGSEGDQASSLFGPEPNANQSLGQQSEPGLGDNSSNSIVFNQPEPQQNEPQGLFDENNEPGAGSDPINNRPVGLDQGANGGSPSSSLFASSTDNGLQSEPMLQDNTQPLTSELEPEPQPLDLNMSDSLPAEPVGQTGSPFGSEPASEPVAIDALRSEPVFGAEQPRGRDLTAPQWNNSQEYVIQDNESFWTISKKVYGTVRYFEVLAELNRGLVPDRNRLKPGTRIQTPAPDVLETLLAELKTNARKRTVVQPGIIQPSENADPASGNEIQLTGGNGFYLSQQGYPMFRVGETDGLTTIAAEHLGRASRWKQIFNMNTDLMKTPDDLRPGMELRLPADASRKLLVDNGRVIR